MVNIQVSLHESTAVCVVLLNNNNITTVIHLTSGTAGLPASTLLHNMLLPAQQQQAALTATLITRQLMPVHGHWFEGYAAHEPSLASCHLILKPHLHDTTCCQTGLTTQ